MLYLKCSLSLLNMYNTLYNLPRKPSDIHIHLNINGCGLLQMASHRKQVAVVAESIRCLGQQYKVCSPEFNLK